ncbi:uncharacterized protein LOC134710886 [Mytilus trossulus]|uniref:uncharacterized protein LOC134710886 n=1 Tax=Mytilus trossulus TaxID=6551 RepID=UPI0030065DA8
MTYWYISVEHVYIGCYNKDMLSGPRYEYPFDECLEFCNTNGYVYAGVQLMYRCTCRKEDELDSSLKVDDSRCNIRCGDDQYICGGPVPWIMAVYHILEHMYIGCYDVKGGNMLSDPEYMTFDFCLEFCHRKGYLYAGIQFKTGCFCGKENELDSSLKIEDSQCDQRWEIAVYLILEHMYIGCYDVKGGNMLSDPEYMTFDFCLEFCHRKGYLYAGIQFKTGCFCGKEDELDSSLKIEDSQCDQRWEIAVYLILEKETVSPDEVGYSTETAESYTSSTQSHIEANYCSCPCKTTVSKWDTILNSDISKEELLQLIEKEAEQIQKDIAVDKKTISSYIRRQSCATDNRPTSMTAGILAVTIIVLVFMFFICIDCISVYQKCTK